MSCDKKSIKEFNMEQFTHEYQELIKEDKMKFEFVQTAKKATINLIKEKIKNIVLGYLHPIVLNDSRIVSPKVSVRYLEDKKQFVVCCSYNFTFHMDSEEVKI